MTFKFEKEFREAHPETIGETDSHFDLSNYNGWLENILSLHKELVMELNGVIGDLTKNPWHEGNPPKSGCYLVKQIGGFIQMMLWDGEFWKIIWGDSAGDLFSDVSKWMEVPLERVRKGKNLKK